MTVDGRLPSLAGPAVSTKAQDYTIKVLPTFFVNGFDCRAGVRSGDRQPDPPARAGEGGRLCRGDDRGRRHRRAAGAAVAKSAPKQRETWQLDESAALSLEDAGFKTQPPASTWVATIAPT